MLRSYGSLLLLLGGGAKPHASVIFVTEPHFRDGGSHFVSLLPRNRAPVKKGGQMFNKSDRNKSYKIMKLFKKKFQLADCIRKETHNICISYVRV